MRRAAIAVAVVMLTLAMPVAGQAAGGVRPLVLGNRFVQWQWVRPGAVTASIKDRRTGRQWGGAGPDFSVTTPVGPIGSASLVVQTAAIEHVAGGRRLRAVLAGSGLVVTRTVTLYDDVAGFRVTTTVRATLPLLLSGARLAEVHVGAGLAATRHAFRAGADWREPGWPGPDVALGDKHAGTWRATSTESEGPGQWLSLAGAHGRTLFTVTEANDFPSVQESYSGGTATPVIDYTRDVVSLGPFEEQIHVENPGVPAGRVRVLDPDRVVALPPVFVGMGATDGDEAWQFTKSLRHAAAGRFQRAVTFNSNGTNTPGVSLGAKDGMNQPTIAAVAPLARRLGIDTFILDDGWQAESGDWVPDPARFPGDPNLARVRATIAPMRLGLWMTPLHFHPDAATFKAHPEWACAPVGDGLAAYNATDPASGSNAAGIGEWSRAALQHVESRIRTAVTAWGVRYFKFDFLAWLDCAGHGDMYDLHDAFVAMLDRLQASFPDVTFEIDETNDYRLFPFESVTRGPTWFQNGAPGPSALLHNLWDLSPWVPADALGQHFLGDKSYATWPVSSLMAAALLSHLTFFSDLRTLPSGVVAAARPWIDFYHRFRGRLSGGVVYPLLNDPLAGGWTALQSWDPDAGRGALLVFRQNAPDASTTVALRNVPPGKAFRLRRAPDGATVGHATSAQLRAGIRVPVPAARGATVLLLDTV